MEPARRLQAVVPRWWPAALVAMLVAAVGVVVLGLTLERGEVFLITAVFFLVTVWQNWRVVHASVELDEGGMTVRRFRRRRLAWSDVRALRLDPRGGPRLLSVELARGELLYLPPLDEDDTETVMAAHAAASERA